MQLIDESRIPLHPYPELSDVLKRFVTETRAVLADNLMGIYLVGSLASGDFDQDSDVDYIVVTDQELTDTTADTLQAVQRKIHAIECYPAQHLEGSYITLSDLTDWQTVGENPLYYFDNGSTTIEQSVHDNQWHVRWILREKGITLMGPPPQSLLPAIPREALCQEVAATMHLIMNLFEADLHGPLSFWTSRFGQSFTVLTYCRILQTLQTGTVQSKKTGVTWAKKVVAPIWRNFIDQAWHDRRGVRFGKKIGQRADQALLNKTLSFMQYAVAYRNHLPDGLCNVSPISGG